MQNRKRLSFCLLTSTVAVLLALSPHRLSSQQSATIDIDNDDIAGVVTSTKGSRSGRVGHR